MRNRSIPELTLALTMALAAPACGPPVAPDSKNAKSSALDGNTGPIYSSDWVRTRTVRGIHLGMHASEARRLLAASSHVEDATDAFEPDEPWHRRFVAWKFKPAKLPASDISKAYAGRANDPAFNAVLEVYVTTVDDREVVSGLRFRSLGKVEDSGLGDPTVALRVKVNDDLVPAFVYSSDRQLRDLDRLELMDTCNDPPPLSGHFGGAQSPPCNLGELPTGAFMHGRNYPTGVMQIDLRDADVGRKNVRTRTGGGK